MIEGEGEAEGLLGPSDIVFRLDLTAAQMKIVFSRCRSGFRVAQRGSLTGRR
jgi:hypothetical protein